MQRKPEVERCQFPTEALMCIERLTDTLKFRSESPRNITSALGNVLKTKWLLHPTKELNAPHRKTSIKCFNEWFSEQQDMLLLWHIEVTINERIGMDWTRHEQASIFIPKDQRWWKITSIIEHNYIDINIMKSDSFGDFQPRDWILIKLHFHPFQTNLENLWSNVFSTHPSTWLSTLTCEVLVSNLTIESELYMETFEFSIPRK